MNKEAGKDSKAVLVIATGLLVLGFIVFVALLLYRSIDWAERDLKVDRDIHILCSSITRYHEIVGKYPPTLNDLFIPCPAKIDVNRDGIVNSKDMYYPLCKKMPLQRNGKPYSYNPKTGDIEIPKNN